MGQNFFVYIATNKWNRVLYTGKTNNLRRRMYEHRKSRSGFTSKYHVSKLVYFEKVATSVEVSRREIQLKGLSRIKKLRLIWEKNPKFDNLEEKIL